MHVCCAVLCACAILTLPKEKQVFFSSLLSMVRVRCKKLDRIKEKERKKERKKNTNEIQSEREWPQCTDICIIYTVAMAKNGIFNSWCKLNFYNNEIYISKQKNVVKRGTRNIFSSEKKILQTMKTTAMFRQ